MRIFCTVKEFGQLVRGCEKVDCYRCALDVICNANNVDGVKPGIERFVGAETILVDMPEVNSDG